MKKDQQRSHKQSNSRPKGDVRKPGSWIPRRRFRTVENIDSDSPNGADGHPGLGPLRLRLPCGYSVNSYGIEPMLPSLKPRGKFGASSARNSDNARVFGTHDR